MLTRNLYRTLLRIGRKFESRPALKTFIFTERIRFDKADDSDFDSQLETIQYPDKALHQEIYKFCAPGVLYSPQKSLPQAIKSAFRSNDNCGLDATARVDLAFLTMRYLLQCYKVGSGLLHPIVSADSQKLNGKTAEEVTATTAVEAAVATDQVRSIVVNDDTTHRAVQDTSAVVTSSPQLQAGSLLISHPLWLPWPYNHSLILVWSYTEDHAVGFMVNKLYHVKFKEKLTKRERVKHTHLKIFHDCCCFYGGNAENIHSLNFSILHRRHELAGISEKLELPLNISAASVVNDSHSTDSSNDNNSKGDSTSSNSSNSNDSVNSREMSRVDNVLYLTHDFDAVAAAIKNGSVSKDEIKILHGCFNWTDSELGNYAAAHKLFPIQSDFAADIAMCSHQAPKIAGSREVGYSEEQDLRQWGHGYYSWAKTYRMMEGEFRSFSEVQQVNALEDSADHFEQLNDLSSFGLDSSIAATEQQDSDDDENDDFNFSGEIYFDSIMDDDDFFHDDDD